MLKWRKDGGGKKVKEEDEEENKYWLDLETSAQRKSRFNVLNKPFVHGI